MLGIAQQTLAHYEVARLRVPPSMLPTLAETFEVQVDVLGRAVVAPPRGGTRRPVSQLECSIEPSANCPSRSSAL